MKTITPEHLASEVRFMVSPAAIQLGLPPRIVVRCPQTGCGHELQHQGSLEGVAVFECLQCRGVYLTLGGLQRVNGPPPTRKNVSAVGVG